MSEQRQRVEAEARELYPDGQADEAVRINELRAAFIAGRTVSAEQVETAAEVLWERSPFIEALEVTWKEWSGRNPAATETWKETVRLTVTAAGLLIEGDE